MEIYLCGRHTFDYPECYNIYRIFLLYQSFRAIQQIVRIYRNFAGNYASDVFSFADTFDWIRIKCKH